MSQRDNTTISARMDPREIQQMEDQCIQAHAPACTAACPLHVDVRSMIGAVARGDFDEALKIFSGKIPFPGIIARICDHPCQDFCRLCEVTDALQIRSLEHACVEYGSVAEKKKRPVPQKSQHVAVIGGGLSGLTAAIELRTKGYRVTLFEAKDSLGGRLRTFPHDILPPRIITEETARIEHSGISVRLSAEATITAVLDDFDAVYYSPGYTTSPDPALCTNETGHIPVDPVTCSTGLDSVFAGGSLLREPDTYSPISSVADGHCGAVSIDRFFKNVSLSAGRELERPYTTKLYTDISRAKPLPAVPMTGKTYTREEAMSEAARCLQCQCLECMRYCEYLKHFDQYPGKCLRSISKNIILEPGFGMRLATKFINACSLCGLCREMCPTDMDLSFINLEARRILVDKGYMPEAIHYFPIRDMIFSNSEKCALTKHAPGRNSSTYVFFPGCQLTASRPDLVEKTYAYLCGKIDDGVGLMLRCCGAPAQWAGRHDRFLQEVREFSSQWESLGRPVVITACPTCQAMLKENLPHVPLQSLWETLEQTGLPAEAAKGLGRVLAIHDSCSARYETDVQDSVRCLITQLGYTIEELPLNRSKTQCCGYGGLMYHINQDLTERVIKERTAMSDAHYVSYCANCRDFFASRGKPSFHLLELIFGSATEEDAFRKGPGYSLRHENRLRLKQRMLKNLWKESETMSEEFENIRVKFSPGIEEKMEAQCILVEDVQRVIHHAEKTGDKVLNPENGHISAHLRPEIITYWVEYTPEGDGYLVHNVYSHRLQIIEDENPS